MSAEDTIVCLSILIPKSIGLRGAEYLSRETYILSFASMSRPKKADSLKEFGCSMIKRLNSSSWLRTMAMA
jgi:hypothetical protein